MSSLTTYRALEGGKPSLSLGLLTHALWLFGRLEDMAPVSSLEISMLGNSTVSVTARSLRRPAMTNVTSEACALY